QGHLGSPRLAGVHLARSISPCVNRQHTSPRRERGRRSASLTPRAGNAYLEHPLEEKTHAPRASRNIIFPRPLATSRPPFIRFGGAQARSLKVPRSLFATLCRFPATNTRCIRNERTRS